MDLELERNLEHLLLQDYSNYEVIFIVESKDDPAYPIIQRLAERSRVPVRIAISGVAEHTGQKVHNLLVATEHLESDIELIAFVDSDTCPSPEWLGRMVARLYRPVPGAVTGYRWYVPARATIGNCLLYSINTSIAALLGAGSQHIVWGGSWAMRRSEFESIGIRDAWKNTLSDDLVATRTLHAANLQIEYEPVCMTASPMDYSFSGMLQFLRRQHLIGRIYAPRLWYQSLATMLVASIAVFGAVGLVCVGQILGRPNLSISAVTFLAAWYGLQISRGLTRRDLARVYVSGEAWSQAMSRAAWFDVFGAPLSLIVNTLVMCGACWGSRILWRGITYDLDQQGRILKVTRDAKSNLVLSTSATETTQVEESRTDRQLRFDPPQSVLESKERLDRITILDDND